MEFKIVWSDTAISDLKEICDYIAARNASVAMRVGKGILEHVHILASFPSIGPAYPRGTRGPLREIVFKAYRIFYDVSETDGNVEIVHVWHGARDEPEF